jgi:hypothetical protein
MAVVTRNGSRIMTGLLDVPKSLADAGEGGGIVRHWCETVEVGAADSDTSTYLLAVIPSNARILGMSYLHVDDLASSGAPTIDLGLYPIRSGDFTGDVDALTDGITVATAGSYRVIKDIANYGKQAWEFVNGLTADPRCDMYLYATMDDADVNVGGTMTLELYYTID